MTLINAPANIDRLEPAGPPKTTGAGRFAVPVRLMNGQQPVAQFDLIFDGPAAEQLHDALDGHLAAQGADTLVDCPTRRSRADLQ